MKSCQWLQVFILLIVYLTFFIKLSVSIQLLLVTILLTNAFFVASLYTIVGTFYLVVGRSGKRWEFENLVPRKKFGQFGRKKIVNYFFIKKDGKKRGKKALFSFRKSAETGY